MPLETPRTKPNGRSAIPPAGWESWLGSAAVAKRLNISLRTLQFLVEAGHLGSYDAPDGTRRYSQQSLSDFETNQELLFAEDSLDSGDKDAKASREGIPAEAIRATADLLKSAHKQNLELHKLVIEGFQAASEAQQKTIEQLQQRNDHFEHVFMELMHQREEMFDQSLERETTRRNFEAVQQRRTELFEQSKTWGTQLIEIWKQKTFGANETSGRDTDVPAEKMAAVMTLLKSIEPAQLEFLAMMGVFNSEQLDCLEKILGKKMPSSKKTSPGAETPNPAATAPGTAQSAADEPAKGK
jgi:DNA-binding transcriptional MerR regulator